MDNIIEPILDYNFQTLQLGIPITQPGSTYLTKLFLNNKPLYIQTPKCVTRNGFVKTGKKMYCDLMFTNDDTIFINWMENLENKCQELILQKGEAWFQTAMDKSDIEQAFTSPFKIFKSGKYYLLRVNVKSNIKIYNDINAEITIENMKPEMNLISILEIQGIKFTSKNFQIELELKQTMVVSPDPFLEECFIKKTQLTGQSVKPIVVQENKQTPQNVDVSQIVNNILNVNAKKNETQPVPQETSIEPKIIIDTIINSKNESVLTKPLELSTVDETNELSEFDLNFSLDNLETITLKKPNHVYYELYKEAKEKAKNAQLVAKNAYLEAKSIKEKYMLDTDSDSDSDNSESVFESDNENEDFSDNENMYNLNS